MSSCVFSFESWFRIHTKESRPDKAAHCCSLCSQMSQEWYNFVKFASWCFANIHIYIYTYKINIHVNYYNHVFLCINVMARISTKDNARLHFLFYFVESSLNSVQLVLLPVIVHFPVRFSLFICFESTYQTPLYLYHLCSTSCQIVFVLPVNTYSWHK